METKSSLSLKFKEKAKLIIDTNAIENAKQGRFLSATSLITKVDTDRLKAREMLHEQQRFNYELKSKQLAMKKRIRKKLENRNNYLENERSCFLEENSIKLANILNADNAIMPSVCNSLKGIIRVKNNSVIYGENDTADKMFIIIKGKVNLIQNAKSTKLLQRHDILELKWCLH